MTTFEFTAIKLRFKGPIHLGEVGVGLENISTFIAHSDTLWAAIVSTWSRLYGNPDELLPDSESWNPPFLISSAWPFVEDTFYFPRPFSQLPVRLNTIEYSYLKKLKKTTLLDQKTFEKWISGETIAKDTIEELICRIENLKKHVKSSEKPQVFLGPFSTGSRLYYLGLTYFRDNSGLFFLVDFKNESLRDKFFSVLNLLADEGLGGKRTYGLGLFSYSVEKISIATPDESNKWITLSRISPEEALLDRDVLSNSSYSLYHLKGWSLSPHSKTVALRKPIRLFSEGSIFPVKPTGKVVDITPFEDEWDADHRVFRHGLAFTLPYREVAT